MTAIDLGSPEEETTKHLAGHEIVRSAIVANKPLDQISLANGSKKADVKQIVPYSRDTGKYVVRIIADSRTLNNKISAYAEFWSQNNIYNLIE
ncbi:isoflavone reductase [Colletotrichum graminicola M1.001]|uniref:Isoflavone reductase n=1 Tax=Colletotrichum graminicola (strain M1.001 / M2 / FGSC 10212) TaxID=645133 RepID=E3QWB4_COLGM|nr:isoflavone reductase [Colletotrichum graminicola M1.001]EFQ35148.1 isoflavone reductase [Colletotrichum graminicola M1.001]